MDTMVQDGDKKLTVRCTDATAHAFKAFAHEHKQSLGETVQTLLDAHADAQSKPVEVTESNLLTLLHCTAEEVELVSEACLTGNVDFWHLVKVGLLAHAKRTNSGSLTRRQAALATPKEGVRSYGTGYFKVKEVADQLMQANVTATTPHDIVYLSKTTLKDLSGANLHAINQYFARHQADIDAHHHTLGFTSPAAGMRHNQQRGVRVREANRATKNREHQPGIFPGEKNGSVQAEKPL